MQKINAQEDQVICLDLFVMAEELLSLVDKKLAELNDGKRSITQDADINKQINSLTMNAKGC